MSDVGSARLMVYKPVRYAQGVRYTQGGGLTDVGRDMRERIRLEAIARDALYVPPRRNCQAGSGCGVDLGGAARPSEYTSHGSRPWAIPSDSHGGRAVYAELGAGPRRQ